MTDKSGTDGSNVRSVQFRMLDVIQQGVAPVEPVGLEIDGQAVGPVEEEVLEDHQVSAVEVSPADVGRHVPLGVEDETKCWGGRQWLWGASGRQVKSAGRSSCGC